MGQMSQCSLSSDTKRTRESNRQVANAVRRVRFEAALRAHSEVLKLKVRVQGK